MSLLFRPTLACLCTLLTLSTAFPAHADSFTSSAASAASQSIGTLSGSITHSSQASSNSSSPKPTAAGNYDVIRVAELGGERDLLRLHLVPSKPADAGKTTHADRGSEPGSFTLDLPRAALGTAGIATGDVVAVRERPYGLEFARARSGEAFFLAVADDWMRDMQARPL